MFGVTPSQLSPEDRKQLNEHAAMVQRLVASEGWKLFVAAQSATLKQADAAVREAKDPWTGARALGAYLTLVDLLSWPERELRAVAVRLESGF